MARAVNSPLSSGSSVACNSSHVLWMSASSKQPDVYSDIVSIMPWSIGPIDEGCCTDLLHRRSCQQLNNSKLVSCITQLCICNALPVIQKFSIPTDNLSPASCRLHADDIRDHTNCHWRLKSVAAAVSLVGTRPYPYTLHALSIHQFGLLQCSSRQHQIARLPDSKMHSDMVKACTYIAMQKV